jgi:hypothetical protein
MSTGSSATVSSDERFSAIQQILGAASAIPGVSAARTYTTAAVGSAVGYASDPSTSRYILSVLMYTFLYLFILFLILVIVNYAVTPVFQFAPGSAGIIPVNAARDDKVYWNTKSQPPAESRVPLESDPISQYTFLNNFTVSVDLYLRRPVDTSNAGRIIFYKTYSYGSDSPLATPPTPTTDTSADLTTYMADKCSMMAYLDQNDLYVMIYSGDTQYSSKPIRNVPTYKPFRLSVIVETGLFTVYINEMQAFQRVVGTINDNSSIPGNNASRGQRFYSPPAWSNSPTQTLFLQNFHLWPRAISYAELKASTPSLAAVGDFDLPVEAGASSCS